jgi:hypothetical protein
MNPESKILDSPHPPSLSSVPGFDSGLIPARIQTIEINLGDGGGEEGLESRNLDWIPEIWIVMIQFPPAARSSSLPHPTADPQN